MDERKLADNIMRVHGKSIWEKYANGCTVGGNQMMDYYCQYFAGMNDRHTWDYGMALRHWVASAGVGEDGKFVYVLGNHIMNC